MVQSYSSASGRLFRHHSWPSELSTVVRMVSCYSKELALILFLDDTGINFECPGLRAGSCNCMLNCYIS